MGKSKNKKSRKSEVDEALDNFGGRYEMKYDENGNATWEKVETEEELLNRLFKESKKSGSEVEDSLTDEELIYEVNKVLDGKIESEADINTSLEKTLKDLLDAIDVPYKIRNSFPSSKIDKAMSEFHTLSPETQELCLNDNFFNGILLTVNAFNEIITAMITHEPMEAKSYTELLNELYRIETFYKNNSNDVNHKNLN